MQQVPRPESRRAAIRGARSRGICIKPPNDRSADLTTPPRDGIECYGHILSPLFGLQLNNDRDTRQTIVVRVMCTQSRRKHDGPSHPQVMRQHPLSVPESERLKCGDRRIGAEMSYRCKICLRSTNTTGVSIAKIARETTSNRCPPTWMRSDGSGTRASSMSTSISPRSRTRTPHVDACSLTSKYVVRTPGSSSSLPMDIGKPSRILAAQFPVYSEKIILSTMQHSAVSLRRTSPIRGTSARKRA